MTSNFIVKIKSFQGLGDVIHMLLHEGFTGRLYFLFTGKTSACQACLIRRRKLNERFPFKGATKPCKKCGKHAGEDGPKSKITCKKQVHVGNELVMEDVNDTTEFIIETKLYKKIYKKIPRDKT